MATRWRPGFALLSLSMMACGSPASGDPDSAMPAHDASTRDAPIAIDAPATTPDAGPPIQDCLDIPRGQWQDITPPDLHREWWCWPDFNDNGCGQPGSMRPGHIATYGAHDVASAPGAPGTVYLGTSSLGFWRSSDCGAHWVLTDGGDSDVDGGRNWTIVVDPIDAQTVYTTAGYAQGGVYKSSDGGGTWQQMLPSNIEAVASFVEKITLDPTDHLHLLVSFHDACLQSATTPDMFRPDTPLAGNLPVGAPTSNTSMGMPGWGCLAETFDAGSTWTLAANALAWEGLDGPGQAMVDRTTWFYASNTGTGIYLTRTGGASPDGVHSGWTQVVSGNVPGSVYVAPDHTFYTGNGGSIIHSINGMDWMPISDASFGLGSINGSTPIVQGGSQLYVSVFSFSAPARYYVSPIDPVDFAEESADSSAIPNGGAQLEWDATYGVLYSSNLVGGLWRLRP